MSSPKKIKNLRLTKIMKALKKLEDAIEEINKMKELETEIINRINELEENLRLETVRRRMKEKPVILKMKNKEITKKKKINHKGESNIKISREVIEEKFRELNTKRNEKKKRNEKINNRRN